MLEAFSCPRSVAVVGASRDPEKLGHVVLSNILKSGYQGKTYPVNPHAEEISGLKCYSSVLDISEPVELAIIALPAKFVASALEECGKKGVSGAIVISAGFREASSEGIRMERELLQIAKRYGMRMLGPNCLGVIDTICPINASFAADMALPGQIAFMSQSGALCTAILDWSLGEGVGFSRFVSIGNKADLSEVDFLRAWSEDPHTKVIIIYLEGVDNGREFMETARQVARKTPIIAIKSGTTQAGSRAVSSHTGTLAGSERAYDAAFSQSGVLRAQTMEELFDYSLAFAYQPLLKGNRIAIITNAGGPGIMATDAAERAGLQLASLQRKTIRGLRANLPPAANTLNPIDVLGDALADRYALALRFAIKDENVDGVLVVLTPQAMTQISETAHAIGQVFSELDSGKPILTCFMGQRGVSPGVKILASYNIPNYAFPERAVGAMKAMFQHHQWLQRPAPNIQKFKVEEEKVRQVFHQVRAEGRLALGEAEARLILQTYGLRIPQSRLVTTAEEAVKAAEEIGYPVVMKIASPDILHKTDIGGVRLDLYDASDVQDAFDLIIYRATRHMPEAEIWGMLVQQMMPRGKEVIIGMNRDPQFGPLLMFGLGGIYVEALRDVSFRVAPLSKQEAREMVAQIRSYHLLRGVRGESPADIEAIVECILRMSQLVTDFPEIVEMDINPLVVYEVGRGTVALDARLVLASDVSPRAPAQLTSEAKRRTEDKEW